MRTVLVLAGFLALPVSEVALFAWFGGLYGVWTTVALVLLTAGVGLAMVRSQGLGLVMRARSAVDRGDSPKSELLEGAALAVAGVCLMTPGFITDALGFVLLAPPIRSALARRLVRAADRRPRSARPIVIDADYQELRDDDAELDRPSGPR